MSVRKDVGFVGSVLSWEVSLGRLVDLHWLLDEPTTLSSEQYVG